MMDNLKVPLGWNRHLKAGGTCVPVVPQAVDAGCSPDVHGGPGCADDAQDGEEPEVLESRDQHKHCAEHSAPDDCVVPGCAGYALVDDFPFSQCYCVRIKSAQSSGDSGVVECKGYLLKQGCKRDTVFVSSKLRRTYLTVIISSENNANFGTHFRKVYKQVCVPLTLRTIIYSTKF